MRSLRRPRLAAAPPRLLHCLGTLAPEASLPPSVSSSLPDWLVSLFTASPHLSTRSGAPNPWGAYTQGPVVCRMPPHCPAQGLLGQAQFATETCPGKPPLGLARVCPWLLSAPQAPASARNSETRKEGETHGVPGARVCARGWECQGCSEPPSSSSSLPDPHAPSLA